MKIKGKELWYHVHNVKYLTKSLCLGLGIPDIKAPNRSIIQDLWIK
jgi:hypothetical protein